METELNSLTDAIIDIHRAVDSEGVMRVYVVIARQIDSRKGGLYGDLFSMTHSHQGVIDACYAAFPEFETFYKTWAEMQAEHARKSNNEQGCLKWVVLFLVALGIESAKQVKKDVDHYSRR